MLPLQISARNITLSPELEADIRERAERLRLYYDRIMGCRVMVEVPQRRRHDGILYHVRIDITVPGGELVIRPAPGAPGTVFGYPACVYGFFMYLVLAAFAVAGLDAERRRARAQ